MANANTASPDRTRSGFPLFVPTRLTSRTGRLLGVVLLTACTAGLAAPLPAASSDPVKPLVAVLQSSNSSLKDKADACRELARIGTSEAVAPLAALLYDYDLSPMARYALEPIPDPAVDKALREAATRLHGRLLIGVMGSIGVRRDPKAVRVLALHLDALNPEVAQAAARALGKIGNPAAAKALEAALRNAPADNRVAFCESLICCADALAAHGDRQQAILIYDRVQDMDLPHQVHLAALRGAILARQAEGLPMLLNSMREGDFTIFAACMRISQEMPGAQVTRALAGALSTPYTNRQMLLIETLGHRRDAAALPALLAVAKDGPTPARVAAIRTAPEIGDVSALPTLLELLRVTDKDISTAARDSLAALQGKQVDDVILAMLSDTNRTSRIMAMDLISRRHMTSAMPALLAAAQSPDQEVRAAAIKNVGELGGPDQLPALLDLLAKATSAADLDGIEQAMSALCLRAADPNACVAKLDSQLATAQPAQQCVLIRVLAAVGGANALKATSAAVKSPKSDVHAAAVRALAGWSTADAAPDLLELAKGAATPTEKMICLRGYLRLAGQADLPVDRRLAMCRQAAALAQKDDEKKLLLAALGAISSPESLDLILPYLDEEGTKDEAASAVVEVSDKLLKQQQAAKFAPHVSEVLDKVVTATSNTDLSKRAKELQEQATRKAAAK